MKKLTITIIIGIILLSTSVNAYYCYQESANTTNQTGIDGSCGLNYDGVYFNTIYNGGGFIEGYLYINYTKPLFITSAIWQVKHGNALIENISITDECKKTNIIKLRIHSVRYGDMYDNSEPQCYNETTWISQGTKTSGFVTNVGSDTDAFNMYDGNWSNYASACAKYTVWQTCYQTTSTSTNIFEEAMIWNISEAKTKLSNFKVNNYNLKVQI